jgi:thiol-disulfide isomerase/thioredoxin
MSGSASVHSTVRRILLLVGAVAAGAALVYVSSNIGTDRSKASPALSFASGDWAGKSAADFALRALDGRRVRLSDFRGKVVIVNFWATWCGPCKVEMPWLVEFYERYRASGLEILGVSVDDGDPDRVAKFVRARRVSYTILLKDDAVVDAYGGLRFLPQSFFIGRDGKIIKRTYGIQAKREFEADVTDALGLPRPHA